MVDLLITAVALLELVVAIVGASMTCGGLVSNHQTVVCIIFLYVANYNYIQKWWQLDPTTGCTNVIYQCHKVVSMKCNEDVRAIVHKFAYMKTIECHNVVSSSMGFARSTWNSVQRYDLVAVMRRYG